MVKKSIGKSIGEKLESCRLEFKWVMDLFWFTGFLLIALLIPLTIPMSIGEILIYVGIGFSLGVAILHEQSKFWIIPIGFILSLFVFLLNATWGFESFFANVLNFLRHIIHLIMLITVGNLIGSVSRSGYEYYTCKRRVL